MRSRPGQKGYAICSLGECQNRHYVYGFCRKHYAHAKKKLTEEEFCRFKEYKAEGFKMEDIAYELAKMRQVIKDAWRFESYAEYEKGKKFTDEYFYIIKDLK